MSRTYVQILKIMAAMSAPLFKDSFTLFVCPSLTRFFIGVCTPGSQKAKIRRFHTFSVKSGVLDVLRRDPAPHIHTSQFRSVQKAVCNAMQRSRCFTESIPVSVSYSTCTDIGPYTEITRAKYAVHT